MPITISQISGVL